jgi:putative nucleotidyltransferase with HDIG domain
MRLKPQVRTVSAYVIVSSLWIWLSNRVLRLFVEDADTLSLMQSLKGTFFVVVTGALLYVLIDRDLRRMSRANRLLLKGNEQSLRALVHAMDIRHKETSDHSDRVMRMTLALAKLAGLRGEELRKARFGALLHDIGKLALPDAILIKPGPLSEEEIQVMRTHPQLGYDLLQQVDFLRDAAEIPYNHHERWDGGGYPRGLRGEEIPLAARVFSVVDVWDALSFPRVYKPAWPQDEVVAYLRKIAGSQLDPKLVELFLANYEDIKRVGLAD